MLVAWDHPPSDKLTVQYVQRHLRLHNRICVVFYNRVNNSLTACATVSEQRYYMQKEQLRPSVRSANHGKQQLTNHLARIVGKSEILAR